jgi:hypothetical protein
MEEYDTKTTTTVILLGILDEDEMGLVKNGLFSLASSAP